MLLDYTQTSEIERFISRLAGVLCQIVATVVMGSSTWTQMSQWLALADYQGANNKGDTYAADTSTANAKLGSLSSTAQDENRYDGSVEKPESLGADARSALRG